MWEWKEVVGCEVWDVVLKGRASLSQTLVVRGLFCVSL